MRPFTIAAVLAATAGGLIHRPAQAGWGVPPAAPPPAAEGAPPSVPEPPPPVAAPPPVAPDDEARRQALQERLFASEALSVSDSRVTRNGIRMDADSFYQLVGRPDLADARHGRRATKTILIVAGASAMTLGAFVSFVDSFCFDSCNRSDPTGGMIFLGGATLTLIGVVISSDPTDGREKNVLVEDYNRRLRARLGLAGALETALGTARVSATASPNGQSGLLVARGSF